MEASEKKGHVDGSKRSSNLKDENNGKASEKRSHKSSGFNGPEGTSKTSSKLAIKIKADAKGPWQLSSKGDMKKARGKQSRDKSDYAEGMLSEEQLGTFLKMLEEKKKSGTLKGKGRMVFKREKGGNWTMSEKPPRGDNEKSSDESYGPEMRYVYSSTKGGNWTLKEGPQSGGKKSSGVQQQGHGATGRSSLHGKDYSSSSQQKLQMGDMWACTFSKDCKTTVDECAKSVSFFYYFFIILNYSEVTCMDIQQYWGQGQCIL